MINGTGTPPTGPWPDPVMDTSVDISVVLPIHNERDNLLPLFDEIAEVLTGMGKAFEIIAVDDGSTDGSVAVLRQEAQSRPSPTAAPTTPRPSSGRRRPSGPI